MAVAKQKAVVQATNVLSKNAALKTMFARVGADNGGWKYIKSQYPRIFFVQNPKGAIGVCYDIKGSASYDEKKGTWSVFKGLTFYDRAAFQEMLDAVDELRKAAACMDEARVKGPVVSSEVIEI